MTLIHSSKEIRQKYHLSLKEVHVSNESLISYKSNKYSVPRNFIGLNVGLSVRANELHIYYKRKIITIHQISNKLLNIKDSHELKYQKEINQNEEKTIIRNEMENLIYD